MNASDRLALRRVRREHDLRELERLRAAARARDRELVRLCRARIAVDRAVAQVHGVQAAEAVGHFLRQGLPGPSSFPLPAGVAAMACRLCGRPWGEHSVPALEGCGSVDVDDLRVAA